MLLGQHHRRQRRHRPPGRVRPAQQRLRAGDQAVLGPDDRLVGQGELLAVQGRTQVLHQLHTVRCDGCLGQVDDLVTVAALALDLVHRQIRVVDELIAHVVRVPSEGDPHAGGDRDLQPDTSPAVGLRQAERRSEGLANPAGHGLGVARVAQVLAQDHELVPGHPGQGVTGPQQAAEAPAHRDQQRVADRMAVRIVHLLEPVEVGEQHRRLQVRARCTFRDVVQAHLQHGPVREPGQRVVQRGNPQRCGALRAELPGLGVQQVRRGDVGQGLRR